MQPSALRRSLVCAAAAAIVWAPTAAFALKDQAFRGDPKLAAGTLGLAVWEDDSGMHIRASTAGKAPRTFAGTVCADTVADVVGFELEDGDKAAAGEGAHCVEIAFTVNGGIDGVDFKVTGPGVNFDIKLDGQQIAPKHVLIGGKGKHPKVSPFILNRT